MGGPTLFGVLATWFVRRKIPEQVHSANNEVAGFIFAVVGVVYAVLLAFLVLVVWEDLQDAQATVEREANGLGNLYRVAAELPPPFDAQLSGALLTYARSIVDDEWQDMTFAGPSPVTEAALDAIWDIHLQLHRSNVNLPAAQTELFGALQNLTDERRIRLLQARSEIPPLMWVLLWGGAFVTIGFTLFFRAPNSLPHYMMIAMLTIVVTFILFLILELDLPFTGEISVPPTAITQAINALQKLQVR